MPAENKPIQSRLASPTTRTPAPDKEETSILWGYRDEAEVLGSKPQISRQGLRWNKRIHVVPGTQGSVLVAVHSAWESREELRKTTTGRQWSKLLASNRSDKPGRRFSFMWNVIHSCQMRLTFIFSLKMSQLLRHTNAVTENIRATGFYCRVF